MQNSSFSSSYTNAREHFFAAATSIADAHLDPVDYPETGPAGEDLSTDVAWLGPADAERVLVMASGTHGVEGFCGSAAQIEWLKRFNADRAEGGSLPGGLAVMLIHAVNPYGFAWCRRVTHENVDLNRNWLEFSTANDFNREYDDLAELLCPATWDDATRANTLRQLAAYIGVHGKPKFVQVVSAGQHRYPDGLFYGGTAETIARRNLTQILQRKLAYARHVGVLDFHSGLGSPGCVELIAASNKGDPALARAQSWYGAAVKPIGTQGDDFAKISGDWLSALPDLLPHSTITAIALEFGTVPALQVLDALRADNWLHMHGDRKGPAADSIRKQMLDAFNIDSELWRGMVLGQSLHVAREAMAGLLRQ